MHPFRQLQVFLVIILCLYVGIVFLNSDGECSTGKDYILGVGDIIKIQVWENDDLNRIVEISQEGAFTFPLIGRISVLGLSVFEAEEILKKRLGGGYLVSPQLSVSVVEYKSQKVFVFGEVKKPGAYIIRGNTPLLEVVAMADGFTDKASQTIKIVNPTKSLITTGNQNRSETDRQDRIQTIDLRQISTGDIDKEYLVTWGASIYVEKIEQLFIIGEVKNPGRFEWQNGLTIHQAISIAGGPTKRAAMSRTKVSRVVEGDEKTLSLDINDPVKPDDIIKVPESYF